MSRPPSSATAVSMIFWQVASSRMSPGQRTALRPAASTSRTVSSASASSLVEVAEHHVGALPGEGQGDGAADAGVAAGDHRPLAGEPVASAVAVLAVVGLVLHLFGQPGMGLLFIGAVRLLVLVGGIGFRRLIGHTNQAIAAVARAPDGGLLHVPEGGRPDFSFVVTSGAGLCPKSTTSATTVSVDGA